MYTYNCSTCVMHGLKYPLSTQKLCNCIFINVVHYTDIDAFTKVAHVRSNHTVKHFHMYTYTSMPVRLSQFDYLTYRSTS